MKTLFRRILIAVLAGAMTYVVSSGSKSADVAPPVATVDVLVAARDLPARSALYAPSVGRVASHCPVCARTLRTRPPPSRRTMSI